MQTAPPLSLAEWKPETFEKYRDQEVEIAGFAHKSTDGAWFLTSIANLKSCCVGSLEKSNQQILISESPLELARISRKILDEDGQDVATDCSDSPRVCEKCGLADLSNPLHIRGVLRISQNGVQKLYSLDPILSVKEKGADYFNFFLYFIFVVFIICLIKLIKKKRLYAKMY